MESLVLSLKYEKIFCKKIAIGGDNFMIYVTGDTHGRHDSEKLKAFSEAHPFLTANDYVIIAGDFGGVWAKETMDYSLEPFKNLPFTLLFVDGNHENFDLLESFPVTEWNGGKVHVIEPKIIHLMRGQVFNIDGKTIFTFGGATSTDRDSRIEGISWWAREMPSDEDIREANVNLKKVNFKVDYVITHSCDERALYYPPLKTWCFMFSTYPENFILSYFEEKVSYKHWYFGHYHLDGNLTEKKTVLFNNILSVEGD